MISVFLLALVAADPADVPYVRGLLVTHVGFDEKDREKVTATAIKLLASCTSSSLSKEEDFENIIRQCHLHVKLAKPEELTVNQSQKMKVDELAIGFPTNTGGIWVRSGKDYHFFTKFDYKVSIASAQA